MIVAGLVYSTLWCLVAFAVQTDIDRSRYDEGRKQFELVQRQSEMPQYGQCWRDAMVVIQSGCKRLSDTTQARLALAYLNCFLEIQGRSTYDCSEEADVKTCVQDMREADHSSFTTFFTHTQNICYFLQAQVWQEGTESTINRLAVSSSQVADQLESSHQLQQDMLSTQNQSLKNQEKLMTQAHTLSGIINSSSQNVRELFEDLKRSTQEQRQIIGDLFEQLAKLQSTILGEVSGFYSLFYYFLSMLVCYLITSTSRTSGARVWLFLIMTLNVVMEQTLLRWIASVFQGDDPGNEQLYWLQRQCRRVSMALAMLVLMVCAYKYQDINAMNNRLLVEIRKQNSDLRRFITGHSEALGQQSDNAVTSSTGEGVKSGASTDSDYTSDDGNDGDDSDADSDKTYILPENKGDTDTESFLTVQDDDVSEADRVSMLCELYDLRKSTPVRDLTNSVESWLNRSHNQADTEELESTTPNYRGSLYNLRPRRGRPSPNISPASQVESAKSFSKTVHQMQQISEKNSRLIRAYQQQGSPFLVPNHINDLTPPQSSLRSSANRGSPRTEDVERSSIVTRSSRASSRKL